MAVNEGSKNRYAAANNAMAWPNLKARILAEEDAIELG